VKSLFDHLMAGESLETSASILLIVVIQCVPGISRTGVLVLLDALIASIILFVAAAFWEMWQAFARPNKPLQPTSGMKSEVE
jgi:hypothetical protein